MQLIPGADLIEVFSSLQGEGAMIGRRQAFLRFSGCNLSCDYCDTSFLSSPVCRIEENPGSGDFITCRNPVPLDRIMGLLEGWLSRFPGAHHSISITGGEPLLHAELLQLWLPQLRQLLPVSLETNGTLPAALRLIVPFIDYVAMDIKLPSATGIETDWECHDNFLRIAAQIDCTVKLVVDDATSDDELSRAATVVNAVSPSIPVIIQPITRHNKVAVRVPRLLAMQSLVAAIHPETIVIPQTHVFLGVM
ncbi:MAG: 7-carboxy-7-deazaguanine synthase QueE [Pelovirga sp.]